MKQELSATSGRDRLATCIVLLVICLSLSRAEAGTTRYLSSSGGNDTAAINNLINGSSAGDTVYLNSGTFRISGAVQAKSGVAIVGAGKSSTTVLYTGGGGAMIELGGKSNVRIADLGLNGNGAAAYGVNGWSGSGHLVEDTLIQNFASNAIGIYFSSAVTDSRIVDNQISNIGVGSEWGAGIRMAWGSSRNQVIGNTVSNAGRGGIFGNDGSTDLVIRNNTVTGSGSGGTGLGIEIWRDCHRSVIQDNNVDQWLSVDSSNQVAVRNNAISGGYIGLEMGTAGSDIVYSGNTVSHAATGLSMSNAGTKERILFANNTISSSSVWGAQIQGGDGNPTIQQLYFYKNTIQGTGGTFPNAGVGLRFNCDKVTAIQNITLDGNTFANNNGFGIALGSWPGLNNFRNLCVVDNTITNNRELAVTGSFGGGLAWQLGAPPGGLGLTFAGAAATDNNRSPVSELAWSGNTLTNNGAGYIGTPWPSDRGNANNQWTSTGTFLSPGNMPSVSIGAPTEAIVGEPVQFSLNYTAGANPLGRILWDLGEGVPATTRSPSFTYTDPGTYKIDLVVWDTAGRAAFDEISLVIGLPDLTEVFVGPGTEWNYDAYWKDKSSPKANATLPGLRVENNATLQYLDAQGTTQIAAGGKGLRLGNPGAGGGTLGISGGSVIVQSGDPVEIGVGAASQPVTGMLALSDSGVFVSLADVLVGGGTGGSMGLLQVGGDGKATIAGDSRLVLGGDGAIGIVSLHDSGSLRVPDMLVHSGFINFAPECRATLTVSGRSRSYYEDLVSSGLIRLEGQTITRPFDDLFVVDQDTLMLAWGPLEGDLNGDGFVGSEDLDIVRGQWGRTVTAGDASSGDPSGDGLVGAADLDLVRAAWGTGTPTTAVPEPTAVFLGCVGAVFLARRATKRGTGAILFGT